MSDWDLESLSVELHQLKLINDESAEQIQRVQEQVQTIRRSQAAQATSRSEHGNRCRFVNRNGIRCKWTHTNSVYNNGACCYHQKQLIAKTDTVTGRVNYPFDPVYD